MPSDYHHPSGKGSVRRGFNTTADRRYKEGYDGIDWSAHRAPAKPKPKRRRQAKG